MTEIHLDGKSKDMVSDNIDKLRELFPLIFEEDKINFDKLKAELGEYVDDSREKYSFTWLGKNDANKESQKRSNGTLRPCREDSKNWDETNNLYIEGDNLEVLKLLQKSYPNKIKCIYIDPPYNRGDDLIYQDDYTDNLQNYLESTEQHLISNKETDGRFHTKWLNMMYPRLKLARTLLRDDGVIFISIDDNEVENLKKICNEIFGENNFIGQWNWIKSQTPPNLSNKIKKNVEYILCYEKRRNNSKYKGLKKISKSDDPITKPQNTIKKLTFAPGTLNINMKDTVIEKGIYGTKKYPNKLLNDLVVENNTNKNEVVFENKFIWVQDKLNEEIKNGTKLNLSKNLVLSYKKSNYENEVPSNLIDAETGNTNENAGSYLTELFDGFEVFDYPKPVELIKYLFNFTKSDDDDIYLDFFSGSASSAEALMKLNLEDNGNRRFILIQIPEEITENNKSPKSKKIAQDAIKFLNEHGKDLTICEIGKERIRRAGDKIIEETGSTDLDIGFKVLKLDSSNLEKWDPNFNNIEEALIDDPIKEDRTNEDLIYEIMLKYGCDLTLPIEKHEHVYSIGCGALVICLDNNITKEVTDEILNIVKESSTSRVVFKDSVFASDEDKANIKQILKDNNINKIITI